MNALGAINRALRLPPPWLLYPLGAVPVIWLFWEAFQNRLGPDPTKVIEHRLGLWALWLLIAVLGVTPLARFAGVKLIRFRRALGVLAFFYVLAHLLVWLVLDVQIPSLIWADIVKRPYVSIGMAAFATLVPLAATSNDLALRRLGALRWRQLHRLTYVAVPLGAVHFVMVVKGWQLEPFVYLGIVLGLLGLRLVPRRLRAGSLAA